jgi:hypothetical protein
VFWRVAFHRDRSSGSFARASNVNPIFCCPGLISEAIYKKVEVDIDVPIISIMYDGTKADKNKVLKPYLHYLKEGSLPNIQRLQG